MAGKILRPCNVVMLLAGAVLAGCPTPPVVNTDNPAGLDLDRGVDETYFPGEPLEVVLTLMAADGESLSAIGLTETIPAGWTFVSAAGLDGAAPPIAPQEGDTDTLEFAWLTPPTFPYRFTYTVMVPRDSNVIAEFSGRIEYRQEAGPIATTALVSTVLPANPAGVVLERSHASTYAAGAPLEVTITIDADEDVSIAALGLLERVPGEWTVVSTEGEGASAPDVIPDPGDSGDLAFVWITTPEFPFTFHYTLMAPEDGQAPLEISGHVEYRLDAGPLLTQELISTAAAAAP